VGTTRLETWRTFPVNLCIAANPCVSGLEESSPDIFIVIGAYADSITRLSGLFLVQVAEMGKRKNDFPRSVHQFPKPKYDFPRRKRLKIGWFWESCEDRSPSANGGAPARKRDLQSFFHIFLPGLRTRFSESAPAVARRQSVQLGDAFRVSSCLSSNKTQSKLAMVFGEFAPGLSDFVFFGFLNFLSDGSSRAI